MLQPGDVVQEVRPPTQRAGRGLAVAVLLRQPCRVALHTVQPVKEIEVAPLQLEPAPHRPSVMLFPSKCKGEQAGQRFQFLQPVGDNPVVQAGVCLESRRRFCIRRKAVAAGKVGSYGVMYVHVAPCALRQAPAALPVRLPFPFQRASTGEVETFQQFQEAVHVNACLHVSAAYCYPFIQFVLPFGDT